MKERWLSMDEICQYPGMSDDTIHAWILKRNMPLLPIGLTLTDAGLLSLNDRYRIVPEGFDGKFAADKGTEPLFNTAHTRADLIMRLKVGGKP